MALSLVLMHANLCGHLRQWPSAACLSLSNMHNKQMYLWCMLVNSANLCKSVLMCEGARACATVFMCLCRCVPRACGYKLDRKTVNACPDTQTEREGWRFDSGRTNNRCSNMLPHMMPNHYCYYNWMFLCYSPALFIPQRFLFPTITARIICT